MQDEIDKRLGKWLKIWRNKERLGITDASRRSGINVFRLKALEGGHANPSICQSEIEKLADVYHVSPILMRAAALGSYPQPPTPPTAS